jgi:hypothetical protein
MHTSEAALAEFKMAIELSSQGRFEEALEKLIWFHENALQHNALGGVRLSYALDAWIELGHHYPEALDALVAIRDTKTAALEAGNGSFSWFHDVAAINRQLHAQPKTVALFHVLNQRAPELAGQCYRVAKEDLIASMQYETCARYLGDPEARFEEICHLRQLKLEIADENPVLGSPEARLREFADLAFVAQTRQLLEILEAMGRTEDAGRIWQLARAVTTTIDEENSD